MKYLLVTGKPQARWNTAANWRSISFNVCL